VLAVVARDPDTNLTAWVGVPGVFKLRLATFVAMLGLFDLLVVDAAVSYADAIKDRERKLKDEELSRREADQQALSRQSMIRLKLIALLGQLVNTKAERIWDTWRLMTGKGSFKNDRAAAHFNGLNPKEHIVVVLQQLALYLIDFMPDTDEADKQNVRVGLYVALNEKLEPIASWDHLKRQKQFFTSYHKWPNKYHLGCQENPSCAVRCIREEKLIIVPDCKDGLSFYHDGQRNYLRSLIAYYIADFCDREGKRVQAALVIDTNVAGFFKEEDRTTIESYMEQFAIRVKLEALIGRLLAKPQEHSRVHAD